MEYVDLGLPSGLLWAKCNVGAEKEEDPGLYFQWGDIVGHAKNSGYYFSESNYNNKGLNNIQGNLDLAHDAAHTYLGGNWRMPTKKEIEELLSNTYKEPYTINGIRGYKFTNKNDDSKYIFIPASGYYDRTYLFNYDGSGYIYSSESVYMGVYSFELYIDFYTSYFNVINEYKYYGIPVRGVYELRDNYLVTVGNLKLYHKKISQIIDNKLDIVTIISSSQSSEELTNIYNACIIDNKLCSNIVILHNNVYYNVINWSIQTNQITFNVIMQGESDLHISNIILSSNGTLSI